RRVRAPDDAPERDAHGERGGPLHRDRAAQQEQMRREHADDDGGRDAEPQLNADDTTAETGGARAHATSPRSPCETSDGRAASMGREGGGGGCSGRTTRKVEPLPSWLERSMKPRCICTSRRVIARPSPVPTWRRRGSRDCQYSRKMAS